MRLTQLHAVTVRDGSLQTLLTDLNGGVRNSEKICTDVQMLLDLDHNSITRPVSIFYVEI